MKVKELLKFNNTHRTNGAVIVHVYDNATRTIETTELEPYHLVHIADKKWPAIPEVGNATVDQYEVRDGRLVISATRRIGA